MSKISRGVFGGSRLTNEERPVQPVAGEQQVHYTCMECIKLMYMYVYILVLIGDFEQFLEQQLELDKVVHVYVYNYEIRNYYL